MLAPDGDWIGLALRATPHGDFVSTATAHGGADLFAAALVLRCPARMVRRGRGEHGADPAHRPAARRCVAGAGRDRGPSLPRPCPRCDHPANPDRSTGDRANFAEHRAARLLVTATTAGRTHLRLPDGSPSSTAFPGVLHRLSVRAPPPFPA
ncbi:hypothetical protein [Streptomyces sp. NPDC059994]|uniref:hypothetical protein n=1 Tax=Streptomyces sp. NPDC059994 TaxID=3347029 RepID=UPI0036CF086E